jgi:hypothetical protein
MKKVKVTQWMLIILIILAVLGLIYIISLIYNFRHFKSIECIKNDDCIQPKCLTGANCPSILCENYRCISFYNNNTNNLTNNKSNECTSSSDCPQIKCDKAPCSYYICENKTCLIKNPQILPPSPTNSLSCNYNDDCILYNADAGFDNCCGDYEINYSESKWQPINRIFYTNQVKDACVNFKELCSGRATILLDNSYYSLCSNNTCIKAHKVGLINPVY